MSAVSEGVSVPGQKGDMGDGMSTRVQSATDLKKGHIPRDKMWQ